MMGVKASSVLAHFYIALPRLGAKEGEEEKKILFYQPADHPVDTKVRLHCAHCVVSWA